MTFEIPLALLLLIAVLASALLFRLAFTWKTHTLALLASSSSPLLLANAASRPRQVARAALVLAALAALALAIAKPHWGEPSPPTPPSIGDIMVVMDVSQSMAAQDVKPSRLGAAKAQVIGLLERLRGERVGLVVFAGSATVRFPLTRDYQAAAALTRAVEVDSAPSPGSAYGDGIRSAVRALTQSESRARAIFLVGDGENFGPDLAAASEEAAAENIPIYGAGIGTLEGGTIPVSGAPGTPAVEKRDTGGQIIVTQLLEDGLQAATQTTGGAYRRAGAGGRELQHLYDTFGQRHAAEGLDRTAANQTDLMPYFILLAFLALVVEWLVPERRRVPNAPVLQGRAAGAVVPLALLMVTGCSMASLEAFELNEQGSRLYADGRYRDALEHFRRAQVQQPELPELDFNAGTGLYQTDELERAVRETQQALNTDDPALRAAAHYNMANAYFRLERFQDALEGYKRALRERPEDVDAKINLELALHRLRQQQEQQQAQNQQQQGQGDPTQQPQPGNREQSGAGDEPQGARQPQQGQPGNPDDELRRSLREAGTDLTIEEALRVLDALREREARFQRQYNQAPAERRPSGRVDKDW